MTTAQGAPDHNTSILIIGAGTWGCSTALHLARRGYKDITVLDRYAPPSPISAGNDVNKIVEEGPSDLGLSPTISSLLLHHATQGWLHDPLFKPFYHPTGYIICAHTPTGLKHLAEHENLTEFSALETPEEFRATMPEGVLTGSFPGWKGGFKKKGAGWVFARGAMMAAFREAERLGARFIAGEKGHVLSLVYENGDVIGAKTADGNIHKANTTILSTGAAAPQLLDMKDQLRPTAWTLAHIRMTPSERDLYKNLPVLFNIESGFFMEPSEEEGDLKICDEHPGYTNFLPDFPTTSIPFRKDQIPLSSESRIRSFLQATMPQLASRSFSFARICWCADTPDRNFLIDRHPEYKSLILAVGGSGHGFMHITSVGGFVADVLEGKFDERLKVSMSWRPETAVGRDWNDLQQRLGGEGRVMNFSEVGEVGWCMSGNNGSL